MTQSSSGGTAEPQGVGGTGSTGADGCPPCTQPCGASRVYCEHQCEAKCHPGSECEDVPCRRRLKASCPCGLHVKERLCGAWSGNPHPKAEDLKCVLACERHAGGDGASMGSSGRPHDHEPDRYALDFYRLALPHRQFIWMLEDKFQRVVGSSSSSRYPLPACDTTRRMLAVEYARLHWRMRTSTARDTVEGWWIVHIESARGTRAPWPLLSELLGHSPAVAEKSLSTALGSQTCLRFTGLRGCGDELYDLAGGMESGLLGVRPGRDAGEALAFFDKGGAGAEAFRRLTGQKPSGCSQPVRSSTAASGGAWGTQRSDAAGLRVDLEPSVFARTLRATVPAGGTPAEATAPSSAAPVEATTRRSGDTAAATGQGAAEAPGVTSGATAGVTTSATEMDTVPDSWEDY